MLTDNQLIRRIKKKQDRKAAEILIDRYYREIYAFTFRQTGQREQAKDLTQEIFIRILQGIYAFDERKASFRTWAYHVASNKITDYYRSKAYKKECMQQSIDQEKDCESGFEKMETTYLTDLSELMVKKELICQIMDIVVMYDREWVRIFQEKCFEEKTFAEIAGEMQISESTVKSRFYQMVKRIRQEVQAG